MLSAGLKEVSILAMDDAGDCALRNFDRRRRRNFLGIGFGIEGHEKGIFAFVKVGEFPAEKYFVSGMLNAGSGFVTRTIIAVSAGGLALCNYARRRRDGMDTGRIW